MNKDFQNCKKWLRKNFPNKKKCFIKLVSSATIIKWAQFDGAHHRSGDDYHGYCRHEMDEDGRLQYTLYVNKDDTPEMQIETLLHEYAHLMQFEEPHGCDIWHGNVFHKYHNRILKKWNKCT